MQTIKSPESRPGNSQSIQASNYTPLSKAITDFADTMSAVGLGRDEQITPDGDLHRFTVESDKSGDCATLSL
ncbi:MAG: hypothetical protein GKR95_00200 [Gammaproteobacteria bacterium]|nr:hypothetical protein [Gammaproteobacteria bacterium]